MSATMATTDGSSTHNGYESTPFEINPQSTLAMSKNGLSPSVPSAVNGAAKRQPPKTKPKPKISSSSSSAKNDSGLSTSSVSSVHSNVPTPMTAGQAGSCTSPFENQNCHSSRNESNSAVGVMSPSSNQSFDNDVFTSVDGDNGDSGNSSSPGASNNRVKQLLLKLPLPLASRQRNPTKTFADSPKISCADVDAVELLPTDEPANGDTGEQKLCQVMKDDEDHQRPKPTTPRPQKAPRNTLRVAIMSELQSKLLKRAPKLSTPSPSPAEKQHDTSSPSVNGSVANLGLNDAERATCESSSNRSESDVGVGADSQDSPSVVNSSMASNRPHKCLPPPPPVRRTPVSVSNSRTGSGTRAATQLSSTTPDISNINDETKRSMFPDAEVIGEATGEPQQQMLNGKGSRPLMFHRAADDSPLPTPPPSPPIGSPQSSDTDNSDSDTNSSAKHDGPQTDSAAKTSTTKFELQWSSVKGSKQRPVSLYPADGKLNLDRQWSSMQCLASSLVDLSPEASRAASQTSRSEGPHVPISSDVTSCSNPLAYRNDIVQNDAHISSSQIIEVDKVQPPGDNCLAVDDTSGPHTNGPLVPSRKSYLACTEFVAGNFEFLNNIDDDDSGTSLNGSDNNVRMTLADDTSGTDESVTSSGNQPSNIQSKPNVDIEALKRMSVGRLEALSVIGNSFSFLDCDDI